MIILGIETTCDETAASIVRDGREILSNVISSQANLHRQYGGVFPELACREHVVRILLVIEEALVKAKISPKEIDLIACAQGPGLIGALLIGVNTAKALALGWKKPFIGVNHVEAHLYAAMMGNSSELLFPALGVVVSGGHSLLLRVNAIGSYEKIATTVDDAIGEAFDKVASLLGLPYPGGPAIEALAQQGNPLAFPFRPGKVKEHPYNFSFSGLKTQVLYATKGQNATKEKPSHINEEEKKDIAASFQHVALGDIVNKAIKASESFGCKAIYLGGGVANNQKLQELFKKNFSLPVFLPPKALTLDNGAMIAGLGFHKFREKGSSDSWDLAPFTKTEGTSFY